jgi:hypothetical protein
MKTVNTREGTINSDTIAIILGTGQENYVSGDEEATL